MCSSGSKTSAIFASALHIDKHSADKQLLLIHAEWMNECMVMFTILQYIDLTGSKTMLVHQGQTSLGISLLGYSWAGYTRISSLLAALIFSNIWAYSEENDEDSGGNSKVWVQNILTSGGNTERIIWPFVYTICCLLIFWTLSHLSGLLMVLAVSGSFAYMSKSF